MWKIEVKELVNETEERLWSVSCHMFSSLDKLYLCMPKLSVHSWWKFVQNNPLYMSRCKTVFMLLLDVNKLNACRSKYTENVNNLCSLCDCDIESVEHMLFDCNALSNIRLELWYEISNSCPSDILKDQIESMTSYNRSNFLLGGLANSYIREWDSSYCKIATFIHRMYMHRNKMVET